MQTMKIAKRMEMRAKNLTLIDSLKLNQEEVQLLNDIVILGVDKDPSFDIKECFKNKKQAQKFHSDIMQVIFKHRSSQNTETHIGQQGQLYTEQELDIEIQ
ncbi:Hypothetical_protein [Hexamita inflata]|uniref:Hypothetical_protein n=1 Tax=Hexamita inflata TaxID=28002 RepID=A0AA86TBV8_9EUKA|nr:Hypothetical protein HINF_LOCUS1201 [Hexamita inflata]